jgi:hypothetical protein
MLAHLSLKMVESESGKIAMIWARESWTEWTLKQWEGKGKNLLQTGSYTATTFAT